MARCFRSLLLALSTLTCALAVVAAAHAGDNNLAISDPWVRTVVPSRPAAGYFTLTNKTAKAEELVGASSPACGTVMLHQSVDQNGVEKMLMVKSIAVPPGGQIKFAPGGYHLMCMMPSKDVMPGHSMPITLRFADGGTITASFPIRSAMGATGATGTMGSMGK